MGKEALDDFKYTKPSLSHRIPIGIGDGEEDDGSELSFEVLTEPDREGTDGQALTLSRDVRKVGVCRR